MPKGLDLLVRGYKKFRKKYFKRKKDTFNDLVRHGQKPKILIIACSDSRVDPAILTNCQPGDLFVIRNVANLVPPFEEDNSYHGTSAALEFGVCNLEVKHIIVFGHTECGGIASLLAKAKDENNLKGFISKWIEIAQPAYKAVVEHHENSSIEEQSILCGQYSLMNSLRNLQTFPWIRDKVQDGTLVLHAWHFNLSTGMIKYFDSHKNDFFELKSAHIFE